MSAFSFASASAPLATLNLATFTTNFHFDLNSELSFGSVILDGFALDPGIYTFAELDSRAPGKFLANGGSITVLAAIPEPSLVALLASAGLFRGRHASENGRF